MGNHKGLPLPYSNCRGNPLWLPIFCRSNPLWLPIFFAVFFIQDKAMFTGIIQAVGQIAQKQDMGSRDNSLNY